MRILDVALRCLDHGLAVIPVWPDKRKNPKINSFSEYLTRLPTADEWRRWSAIFPNANIAAITGYWLNYVCLDFDTVAAYEFWRWEAGFGIAGQTWTVQTARGYHVWFQVQNEPGRSRVYRNGKDDVLLRAKGGYCIIPPSVHHTGARYTTVSNIAPLLVKSIEPLLEGYTHEPPLTQNRPDLPILPRTGAITIQDMVPPIGKANYRGAYQACCPFHDDKTPSAWVNPGQGRFGCNKCFPDMYWDAINIYAMLNGITNSEAFTLLHRP